MLKILDLFCGGGGASMGIHQALKEKNIKHEILGMDIREMPDYPFNFVQSDVFDQNTFPIDWFKSFDFAWASPPCQAYSMATKAIRNKGKKYPELIKKTRELLQQANIPFAIENVEKAPIRKDLMLCGEMFDLKVFRHRFFEIENFVCYQPLHPKHKEIVGKGYYTIIAGGFFRTRKKRARKKRLNLDYGTYNDWCNAMGINWIRLEYQDHKKRKSHNTKNSGPTLCSGHPLSEAVPPAYSKYIINQFLKKYVNLDYFIKNGAITP